MLMSPVAIAQGTSRDSPSGSGRVPLSCLPKHRYSALQQPLVVHSQIGTTACLSFSISVLDRAARQLTVGERQDPGARNQDPISTRCPCGQNSALEGAGNTVRLATSRPQGTHLTARVRRAERIFQAPQVDGHTQDVVTPHRVIV